LKRVALSQRWIFVMPPTSISARFPTAANNNNYYIIGDDEEAFIELKKLCETFH